MCANCLPIIPVLPSSDMERDVAWYRDKMGMELYFSNKLYAVLCREDIVLHLQAHADIENDQMPAGSVTRLQVKNVRTVLEELVQKGAVSGHSLKENTPWHTHKIGFYDLYQNAIFIKEDLE